MCVFVCDHVVCCALYVVCCVKGGDRVFMCMYVLCLVRGRDRVWICCVL